MKSILQNRPRHQQTPGGYRPPRPPTSWTPPGASPMQQPVYGYMQPGSYPGQPPQYNMSQPPYGGYLPPTSTGWDQSSNPTAQQTAQVTAYDYYNQQQPQQQQQPIGDSSAQTDSNSYNYGQMPPTYTAPGSYGDSNYSHSATGNQQGYVPATSYAQPGSQAGYTQPVSGIQTGYAQQGYGPGSAYSNTAGSSQDQQTLPPGQSSSASQQGYGAQQPGYGSQPAAQTGYSQAALPGQPGYGQSPQGQKAVYGQGQQPVTTSQVGYGQTTQAYGQSAQGYSQTAPTSGYAQPAGYGQSYVQQQQSYNDSYAAPYAQPSYSSDATHGSYEPPSSAQGTPSGGVTKASPQS